jgi:Putative peptidoglycan binding domain
MAKLIPPEEVAKIKARLKELGISTNDFKADVRAFQRIHGLRADGIPGPKTQEELWPTPAGIPIDRNIPQPPTPFDPPAATHWPRQSECNAYFGPVGQNQIEFLVPYPMRIAWNKKQAVKRFSCHRKVRDALERIFTQIMTDYDKASRIDLGLDLFSGCLNVRKMTGGSNWSMHAWGIAVDMDSERNQFKWGRGKAKMSEPAYDKYWAAIEHEGAIGLGRTRNFDWMHFQFARL